MPFCGMPTESFTLGYVRKLCVYFYRIIVNEPNSQDTGSSNGTFINNQRLSQTNTQSENFEVRYGDIVQFGVDVLENSRKETHGCIIAFLKLFLPDGAATVSNASSCTNLPTGHLYQLNQHIQEAAIRELTLDSKLMNIQKIVDATRCVCV